MGESLGSFFWYCWYHCKQAFFHTLYQAYQIVVTGLLVTQLQHLLYEILNDFSHLSLTVPLVRTHQIFVWLKSQLFPSQILHLVLEWLELVWFFALHILYLWLQFLDRRSGNLQLMNYFSDLGLFRSDCLELDLVFINKLGYFFVLVTKDSDLLVLKPFDLDIMTFPNFYFLCTLLP